MATELDLVCESEPKADKRPIGRITEVAAIREYMLAGNATFTLVSKKTGARFTYRIRAVEPGSTGPVTHFVSLLVGPDNENAFKYLGHVTGELPRYFHGRKSKTEASAPSARAIMWMWDQVFAAEDRPLPDAVEFWHEGSCGRCGRKLTVPSSVERGIGPECAGKMGIG